MEEKIQSLGHYLGFDEEIDYFLLMDICRKRFGQAIEQMSLKEPFYCAWRSETSVVSLDYDVEKEKGDLNLVYLPLFGEALVAYLKVALPERGKSAESDW